MGLQELERCLGLRAVHAVVELRRELGSHCLAQGSGLLHAQPGATSVVLRRVTILAAMLGLLIAVESGHRELDVLDLLIRTGGKLLHRLVNRIVIDPGQAHLHLFGQILPVGTRTHR